MEFDFTSIAAELRYKLLCSFVGPRPIALVTTQGVDGVPNAAPMSFFNVFAQTPPLLILGLQDRAHGPKDTTRNIRETGELVVNLVDAGLARAMVACSVDHPPEIDETIEAGLTLVPAVSVRPARIAEAPVSFECRLERTVAFPGRCIVFAEVVHMHVRDACIDQDTLRVLPDRYRPVARMHGDWYVTAEDWYELKKPAPPTD